MKLIEKIEAHLIAEWRQAWRYWSVKLNGAGLALLSLCQILSDSWGQMPPDLRHMLPYAQGISIALFVAGLAARVITQPKTAEKINARNQNQS